LLLVTEIKFCVVRISAGSKIRH